MDRAQAIFVDGIGAAAATSGVLNTLQGRIFALLYLQTAPLSLDDIASELGQSKSNVSINIRGLTEWHLVKRIHVSGSRRDHYEGATDLVRVMQEIIERRFRWNMRQVMATVEETTRARKEEPGKEEQADLIDRRLGNLKTFFIMMDATAASLSPGRPFPPTPASDAAARPKTTTTAKKTHKAPARRR